MSIIIRRWSIVYVVFARLQLGFATTLLFHLRRGLRRYTSPAYRDHVSWHCAIAFLKSLTIYVGTGRWLGISSVFLRTLFFKKKNLSVGSWGTLKNQTCKVRLVLLELILSSNEDNQFDILSNLWLTWGRTDINSATVITLGLFSEFLVCKYCWKSSLRNLNSYRGYSYWFLSINFFYQLERFFQRKSLILLIPEYSTTPTRRTTFKFFQLEITTHWQSQCL